MIIGSLEIEKCLDNMEKMSLRSGIDRGIHLVREAAMNGCPVHDGELRQNIFEEVKESGGSITGICYTNKEYGVYVEFGTGPKGQAHHEGVSPDVAVSYTQSPWWIHESQISKETAEYYNFFYVDTPQGRFYQCYGQSAHPYMYPALKNNESKIVEIVSEEVRRQL